MLPTPTLITTSPEADTLILRQEQGLQFDYWNVSGSEAPLTTDHCHTWGTAYGAFMICIQA
jgi:hypothetical protein